MERLVRSDVEERRFQQERVMSERRGAEQGTNSEAERRYLAVLYSERREADALGAAWDPEVKCWYVPAGVDPAPFARWFPENVEVARRVARSDPREEFAEALRDMDCIVSGRHPITDGRPHRIETEGERRGKKAGFYVAYLDGHIPAGRIVNFRTGVVSKWKAKSHRHLSEAERAKVRADAATKLRAREAEQLTTRAATAARVRRTISRLTPVETPTPYMKRKQIQAHSGVFTDRSGETYIPMTDADEKLWSMQVVDADGEKRFAKGGRQAGCFHVIGGFGRLSRASVIVIAEGYATAATLTEALEQPVVAAFNAGNLPDVAKALRARYPDKPIVIAGDDDRALELHPKVRRNVGKDKAQDAASAVGGSVMFPVFDPADSIAPLLPLCGQISERRRCTEAR